MSGGRFRRKKNSDGFSDSGSAGVKVTVGSKLMDLCDGNTELYQSLARILILDPRRITVPLESFVADGQDQETKGDNLRAELAYRIAGALALYKGDKEAVQKYFEKALSLASASRPEYKMLSQHAGDAVDVARRYYESASIR